MFFFLKQNRGAILICYRYLTWEDKNYRNENGNLTVKVFDPEVELSSSFLPLLPLCFPSLFLSHWTVLDYIYIFNEMKMKSDSVLEVLDVKKNLIRKKIHFSGTINTCIFFCSVLIFINMRYLIISLDMNLSNFPFDEHRVHIFSMFTFSSPTVILFL